MTSLFLYDDAIARAFEPFSLTRPTCELRAGALLLRERWETALNARAAGVVTASHLEDFEEPWGVAVVNGKLPQGSIIANSRCAVSLASIGNAGVWRCGGRIAAIRLDRDVDAAELADGSLTLERLAHKDAAAVEIAARWIDHVWDFIGFLAVMLNEDVGVLSREARRYPGDAGMITGSNGVFIEDSATIEPQVFFDTTVGAVLVRRGALVQAFTRIVGPCVIGEESQVGGDKISGSSIGNVCRVHGEVSASIFLGHSNKAHDGFLGHSYLGRWSNLGAGTITSNLKNTYGTVQLWTPGGEEETGLQFLGTLLGDHAKTGIGMTLTTGTVIGAGANIYGGVMPPKAVPPFAWGDRPPYSTYRVDKFLQVAERVMARRHVELSARQRKQLALAFERRWSVGERRGATR